MDVGFCTGSIRRPHLVVEWWNRDTACLLCKRKLQYASVDELYRVYGLVPPSGWSDDRVSNGQNHQSV